MMIELAKTRKLSFQGEVVEIFERGGQRLAKISILPTFMEVDVEGIRDAHLGDTVSIEVRLRVEDITPLFNIQSGTF